MKTRILLLLLAALMMLTACASQPEAQPIEGGVQVTLVRADRDVQSNLGADVRASFTLEADVTNTTNAPIGPLDTLFKAELIINGTAYDSDTVFFVDKDGISVNTPKGHSIPAGQTERIMLHFLVQPRKLLTAPAQLRITIGADVYILPLPDAE